MKKEIVALVLALCLGVGCIGCQSEQKDIYDQFAGSETSQEESQAEESAAPEEETQEDALSGELTISVKFPTSESVGLGMVAAEFEEQYPGVTVTIQPGLTMEEAYSGDTALFQAAEKSYTEALAVELTSGAGADLIDVGSLSFNRYAESGVLCDLYTLCDWEETFPEEEYFRGIMDAPRHPGEAVRPGGHRQPLGLLAQQAGGKPPGRGGVGGAHRQQVGGAVRPGGEPGPGGGELWSPTRRWWPPPS